MIQKVRHSLLLCCLITGCSRINLSAPAHYQSLNPIVTMTLDNQHKIVIELYPEEAPNTVNNFISLIQEGYYDGLTFHRLVEDYIIQSGDPLMNNYGSPGYTIQGEFKSNGVKNSLKHTKGVVSMARAANYDSAGSQFFITLEDTPMLNGLYAGFGKVIQGMDVIDEIANCKEQIPIIERVTVDTKMERYPEPILTPLGHK